MTRLYTPEETKNALRELKIKPVNGNVTTKEVTEILKWRVAKEFNMDRTYPESAVRRRTQKGHLKPAPESSSRNNLYKVEDVFDLPLFPRRGAALQAKHRQEQDTPVSVPDKSA